MNIWQGSLLLVFTLCGLSSTGAAQEENVSSVATQTIESETKVREAVQSYVKAYNARDAEAVANHWSPQAVYVSRSSGEQITGRDALKKEFTEVFKGDDVPTLAVTTESVQFVSPNVAIEHGKAVVVRDASEDTATQYSAVYINHGGAWLLDRVTEEDIDMVRSNYERLQGLEFLIGDWVDAGPDMTIRTECQWTRNQNYISRKYSVDVQGEIESSGLQIIGWDAKQESIRSWLFDSSGTFVHGIWTEKDGDWMVQSVATLADGDTGSFTAVFRPVDEDTFGWRKVNRVLDGELMPNVAEVLVRRE